MDLGGERNIREQPPSQILPADRKRAAAAHSGDHQVEQADSGHCGNFQSHATGRPVMKRRRHLADLAQDIRDHIEQETQDNIARGMTPDEARYAALRKFGNATRILSSLRTTRSGILRRVSPRRYRQTEPVAESNSVSDPRAHTHYWDHTGGLIAEVLDRLINNA